MPNKTPTADPENMTEVLGLLRPTFPGMYLHVKVSVTDGGIYTLHDPNAYNDLNTMQSIVRNNVNYGVYSRAHSAIYEWDDEADEWSLIAYIPMGTDAYNQITWTTRSSS